MTESIDEFRGKYFFLSNFYSAPVEYQGYRFENNEAAFQAAKCPERMLDFCGLTPNRAKQLKTLLVSLPFLTKTIFTMM